MLSVIDVLITKTLDTGRVSTALLEVSSMHVRTNLREGAPTPDIETTIRLEAQ